MNDNPTPKKSKSILHPPRVTMNELSERSTAFLHGVASGDPRSDRVIIWTRLTASATEPIAVRWEVATEPAFERVVASGCTLASPHHDFTVKVDVASLAPSRHYYYRFEALGECSPVGRTKTLPFIGVTQVRFAQVCCAKLNVGYFNAYARIADRLDLDFFLHLGDYIYETAEHATAPRLSSVVAERAYNPPHECKTLGDYRRRYAQYRLDPDLQRLHQALPMFATLDDHEIADGAWREGSEDHDQERDGSWEARRLAALQVRWEWLPLRMPDSNNPAQTYASIAVGDLFDLILIDTRTYRDRPWDGTVDQGAQRTALGRQQREWLLGEFVSSNAHWRVIGSPTLMATIANEATPTACKEALRKLKLINPRNDGPDLDPWAGYLQERNIILRHVRDGKIENVVVLSGDVHVSLASELSCESSEEPRSSLAVEFVTPSITSQNLDDKMGWPPRTESTPIEQALITSLPDLRWCELDSHGYVIVDVTRERVLAEWWFVDSIEKPSEGEMRGAAWQVKSGESRLTAARR